MDLLFLLGNHYNVDEVKDLIRRGIWRFDHSELGSVIVKGTLPI